MYAIQTINLTKYYGKSRGIVDLNLEVKKGEFFGFIGPNGAGKSTCIRTMLGLIKCSSGSATVLGLDIVQDKTEILKRVGYMPSETMFYAGMRVKDVLKLSADLRGMDCTEEAKVLCDRLQLDVNKKVEELSYGNKKKVSIVCALQHKPELLILDEPTSGLDPLMQREFFQILRERNAEGTTIFLSSHILAEVQRNCTCAGIIREGRLIACDSVESLSQTNAKRVHVQGNVNIKELGQVRDLRQTENGLTFLYGGEIKQLLEVLSKQPIQDLSISQPDLEEIFMHYYVDGGEA
ncbi:MAG: ABC transporter ATP-binding protein [Tyzzerella sp.]|nr:ABC transporter ATP-binding protein [Tyzzerella sp.]